MTVCLAGYIALADEALLRPGQLLTGSVEPVDYRPVVSWLSLLLLHVRSQAMPMRHKITIMPVTVKSLLHMFSHTPIAASSQASAIHIVIVNSPFILSFLFFNDCFFGPRILLHHPVQGSREWSRINSFTEIFLSFF